MRLGEHTIGLRSSQQQVVAGVPQRDDYGEPVMVDVDVKVEGCLVTPSRRLSDNAEPDDRAAPAITGMVCVAPPGSGVDKANVIVWPIESEAVVDDVLQLTGRTWQVIGEPALWEESVEVRLRAAS